MLLMAERGIRGGITQSVHRWAQANNPYMGSEYNPDAPTRYLKYLDTNNLYGWAMSQPLPTRGFQWADIHPDEIGELANHSDCGYLLEVDVAYPIFLLTGCVSIRANTKPKARRYARPKGALRGPRALICLYRYANQLVRSLLPD